MELARRGRLVISGNALDIAFPRDEAQSPMVFFHAELGSNPAVEITARESAVASGTLQNGVYHTDLPAGNYTAVLRAEGRGIVMGGAEFTMELPDVLVKQLRHHDDRVRKVLAMAREEAIRLQHDYINTEHLLLGLVREGEGVAAAVLNNLNADLDIVQEKVEENVRRGKATIAMGELPYTSRANAVLELAADEARGLRHGYIGTEHLLLGLLREEKGIAAEVLGSMGVVLEDARRETLKLLGSEPGR